MGSGKEYDETLLWVVSSQTCGKRLQARGTAGRPHGCPPLQRSTQAGKGRGLQMAFLSLPLCTLASGT